MICIKRALIFIKSCFHFIKVHDRSTVFFSGISSDIESLQVGAHLGWYARLFFWPAKVLKII